MKKYVFPLKAYLTPHSFVLICVLFVHLLINTVWHALNNAPITWDPAAHMRISFEIVEKITSGRFIEVLYVSNYYPIFIHSVTAFFIMLFKLLQTDSFSIIKFIQFLDTMILLATLGIIYIWTKRLFSIQTALFSTILFSFFPIVYNQSRFFMLDIASVGLFFSALYFLDKSNYFSNKRETVIFCLFSALLLMTKWTGIIYLFIPGLFYLNELRNKKLTKDMGLNLLKGIMLGAIIILPWYLVNLKSLEFLGGINIIGEKGADPVNLFSLENVLQYVYIFTYTQVSPIPALVFFVSLFISFFQRFRHKFFLLSMILGNYLIFTFISNKDARYLIFLLPFVSILISQVLFSINKGKLLAQFTALGLLVFLFIYFLILSLRPPFIEGYKIQVVIPLFGLAHPIDIRDYLVQKPDPNDWQIPAIMNDFKILSQRKEKNLAQKDNTTRVIIASELMYLNASNIQAYKTALGLNEIAISTPDITLLLTRYNQDKFPSMQLLNKYLEENDYVLISKGDVGPEYIRNIKALKQIQNYTIAQDFEPCNSFQFDIAPENHTCFVQTGEILGSGSDVVVDDITTLTEDVKVEGPAKVKCPWGCSFFTIQEADSAKSVTLEKIKEYTLVNGEIIQLFKINKPSLRTSP
jgi:hypothetical protein